MSILKIFILELGFKMRDEFKCQKKNKQKQKSRGAWVNEIHFLVYKMCKYIYTGVKKHKY